MTAHHNGMVKSNQEPRISCHHSDFWKGNKHDASPLYVDQTIPCNPSCGTFDSVSSSNQCMRAFS